MHDLIRFVTSDDFLAFWGLIAAFCLACWFLTELSNRDLANRNAAYEQWRRKYGK